MNEPHHTTDEENYMRPRNSAELSEHLMDKRQINRRLWQNLTIKTYNQRKIITIITKKMKN